MDDVSHSDRLWSSSELDGAEPVTRENEVVERSQATVDLLRDRIPVGLLAGIHDAVDRVSELIDAGPGTSLREYRLDSACDAGVDPAIKRARSHAREAGRGEAVEALVHAYQAVAGRGPRTGSGRTDARGRAPVWAIGTWDLLDPATACLLWGWRRTSDPWGQLLEPWSVEVEGVSEYLKAIPRLSIELMERMVEYASHGRLRRFAARLELLRSIGADPARALTADAVRSKANVRLGIRGRELLTTVRDDTGAKRRILDALDDARPAILDVGLALIAWEASELGQRELLYGPWAALDVLT